MSTKIDAGTQISGKLPLANGGTNVDLSAAGSATAFLAQDAAHVITARSIIAADVPNLDASKITTGQLALARGGTHADLSATGGTGQVLRQSSIGADITVSQLAASDLSNGTTGSGAVVLASAPTMTNPVVGTQSASDNSTKAASTAYVDNLTVNAQTGTSYAILNGDINKLITFTNSAQIAATIAQAGGGGSFLSGWHVWFLNIGTGTVVLTPSTSTISGYQKLVIPPNSSGMLWSDGANYKVFSTGGQNIASGDAGLLGPFDPFAGLVILLNNNWTTVTGANKIRCFKFNMADSKGLARATTIRGTTTAVGKSLWGAMYDSAKNLLFQTPAWDMGSSGLSTVVLTNTWLLLPGDYYFACGGDATTISSAILQNAASGAPYDGNILNTIGTVVQRVGPSPNSISAGVLPSTLGTLAAVGSNTTVPAIYFEP